MVADGVEVQVEPGLPGVEAYLLAPPGQAREEFDVRGAPDPAGVSGEVGGLDEAEGEGEPRVGPDEALNRWSAGILDSGPATMIRVPTLEWAQGQRRTMSDDRATRR